VLPTLAINKKRLKVAYWKIAAPIGAGYILLPVSQRNKIHAGMTLPVVEAKERSLKDASAIAEPPPVDRASPEHVTAIGLFRFWRNIAATQRIVAVREDG
jgi:hypothetical protein